jgi:hypothetical protein
VLDPDLSKDYLDRIQNRTKEKKYCFDHAFGPESTNKVRSSLCKFVISRDLWFSMFRFVVCM